EAAQLLLPLISEHEDNFVVLAQCAIAHFLASNDDFRGNALGYMRSALEKWPKRWDEVPDGQKQFLLAIGWEETAFERNRGFEVCLERLMRNRASEERKKRKKKVV